MAWENIKERLIKPFTVEIPHAEGVVWFPGSHLEIDEWLTSIAQSDDELEELNISRRIRFLQNRWPIEKLLQLEWDGPVTRRTILAMNVGQRAYVLFFDGFTYQVLGALEPKDNIALYQVVIATALQNPRLVPTPPKRIMINRPDIISLNEVDGLQHRHEVFSQSETAQTRKKRSYLANLLIGWVGNWIEQPVVGYWHEDEDELQPKEDFDRKKVA